MLSLSTHLNTANCRRVQHLNTSNTFPFVLTQRQLITNLPNGPGRFGATKPRYTFDSKLTICLVYQPSDTTHRGAAGHLCKCGNIQGLAQRPLIGVGEITHAMQNDDSVFCR